MPYANAEARREYVRAYRKKQRQERLEQQFETFLNRTGDDQFVRLEALSRHELPFKVHTARLTANAPGPSDIVKADTDKGNGSCEQRT